MCGYVNGLIAMICHRYALSKATYLLARREDNWYTYQDGCGKSPKGRVESGFWALTAKIFQEHVRDTFGQSFHERTGTGKASIYLDDMV